MTTLPPAAVGFIEQMSLLAEPAGVPRIGGRILGLLIVEEGPLSSEEIASLLQISRASVSTNTRLLESRGVIRRVSHLGERRDLFEIDNGFPERMIERSLADHRAMRAIAEETRARLPGASRRVKESLRRIEIFTALAVETIEDMLRAWRKSGNPATTARDS